MQTLLNLTIYGFVFLFSNCLLAQHKLYYDPSYWTALRLSGQVDSLHTIWFETTARHTIYSSEFNLASTPSDNLRYNFSAGYHYQVHQHIKLGVVFTNNAEKYSYWQAYRGFSVHRGKVLGFDFDKQISVELFDAPTSFNGNRLLRYAFHTGLHRDIKIGEIPCRVGLYMGVYRFSEDLQSVAPNRRRTDKTRLRAEWQVNLSPSTAILLFAMRETDYWYQVGLFDENGNTISPDGSVNRILPTYGLSLHIKVGQSQNTPLFYW